MNIFKMHIKYDEFGKAFVDKMGVEKYCEKFI
jgi:DNA-directed RNA polymerase subunit N (RpoN/RPB10)